MARSRAAELRRASAAFDRATSGTDAIRVSINDDGPGDTRGFDRLFAGLGATIDAFPQALRDAVPAVREAHAAVFATEGKAGRGGWPALAPRTVRERERLGFGGRGPILVRTGALRVHVLNAPATVAAVPGAVELRVKPGPVVAGRPKYRALARGSGRLPARPMVAIGPAAAAKVTSAISRSLRQRAAANGL